MKNWWKPPAWIRIYSQIRVSEIVSEANYISTNIHRNVLILVPKDSEGYRELIHIKKLVKFPFCGEIEDNLSFPKPGARPLKRRVSQQERLYGTPSRTKALVEDAGG